LSICGFPTSLSVGQSRTCIVANVTRCTTDTNVVTATAMGLNSFGTNQPVVSQDTNRVTVIPIAIDCGIYVRTNGGTAFIKYNLNCPVQQLGETYTVRIGVTNTGQYPLQNVMLTNMA